jgi:hypothetical protein
MAAQPKPPAQAPKRPRVQVAGKQEQFTEAAVELAKKLGWDGEPDWLQVAPARLEEIKAEENRLRQARGEPLLDELPEVTAEIAAAHGITVRDAVRYCAKLLHEHFEAGAFGKEQPGIAAACEHLAVDNADERAAIEGACAAAYEAGKGAKVTEHPIKKASLDAEAQGSAGTILGRVAAHEALKKGK